MGKYEFIGLNFDDTDRDLKPGDYVDSLNLIPPKGGVATSAQRENIKGNLMVPNPHLPTGENKCIGTHEDSTNNRLIFFIWNSNNKHGIYQYLYETNKIEKIFEWEGLKFEKDKRINGVGITDNLLYWAGEGQELRMINIQLALNNKYNKTSQKEISLLKSPPVEILTTTRGYDPSVDYNLIMDDSFQFAYRFVYIDNETSVLSDYSKLSRANYTYNDENINSFIAPNNYIEISIPYPTETASIIKNIEVFSIHNNDGSAKLIKTLRLSDIESGVISFRFYNNIEGNPLSDEEVVKIIESVPRISNSMAMYEGRVFTIADKEGFNINPKDFALSTNIKTSYEDVYSFTSLGEYIDVGIPGYTPSSTKLYSFPFISNKPFFKENGLYKFGIVFHDDYGRRSSVYGVEENILIIPQYRKKTRISSRITSNNPFYYVSGNALPVGVSPVKKYVEWKITGTPPEWATKYSIVRSREMNYLRYYQFGARIEFLVSNPGFYTIDGELPNELGSVYKGKMGNDYIYSKIPGEKPLHIRVPENMPFVPNVGDEVRLLMQYKENQSDKTYKITKTFNSSNEISGFFIEVEPMDIFDEMDGMGEGLTANNTYWWHEQQLIAIEIFTRAKDSHNTIYYEIGEKYNILNPGTPTRSFSKTYGKIYGDTYYISHTDVQKRMVITSPNPSEAEGTVGSGDFRDNYSNVHTHIESPSPTVLGNKNKKPTQTNTPNAPYLSAENNISNTLDYNKVSSDIGKPNVYVFGEKERNRYTAIRFSNLYIQNSLINGYSSFDEKNEYLLPIESGKVRKLIASGGVLLAIHERNTSSIYVNEGFLQTGDGQQFLSKTANVIGDDRTLQGGYGTINPESVVEYNGKVYYFDMNKGEVLRYAENGLTPLAATYKAKSYFTQKSRERLKHKEQAKVYGAYHPYLDMYILTFAAVGEYPAETIAFSEKEKRWITRFSFAPEMYGKINTELVSFYKGNLWVHERNEVRNSFYGTSNNSEIEFVANEHPDYEKKFDNITLDASEPCDVEMSNSKGQVTDLIASEGEFKELAGNWYANILRDKNTPQIELGDNETPLHHGDEMISNTLKVKIKNNNNMPVTINNVKVGYKATSGQHINEK